MKNQITITLIAVLISVASFAQDFEVPKKGAKIYLESTELEVAENEEMTFDLYLVKSRSARKASFEAPGFLAPDGLDFSIQQDENEAGHYTVSLKANEIETGNYSVTVTGKRSGIHTVTGSILSINVTPADAVASKDGE